MKCIFATKHYYEAKEESLKLKHILSVQECRTAMSKIDFI